MKFLKVLKRIPSIKDIPYYLKMEVWLQFFRDFQKFRKLSVNSVQRFPLSWEDMSPCLTDKTTTTCFDRHYIYHLAWAARILANMRPAVHVDIASSLYFCSLMSAFIPITFYDYRPVDLQLNQLTSEQADLCLLPFEDDSIQSLSCMHVVEHVGLGRYGDLLDPEGDLKAISELKRVLAQGGSLLFVIPVGKPKVVFNAHRIYSYEQITDYFSDLELNEFALIVDNHENHDIIFQAEQELADSQTYGCGCFWFKKKRTNEEVIDVQR